MTGQRPQDGGPETGALAEASARTLATTLAHPQATTPTSPPRAGRASPQDDVELREIVRRLRPFALWIGLATATAMTGVYLTARAQPRVYEAQASLMSISNSGGSASDLTVNAPPLTPTAVEQVLHSSRLVEDIIRRLPATDLSAPDIRALSTKLRAELTAQRFELLRLRSQVDQQQRGVYDVLVRTGDPQTAKTLAGLTARSLLAWDTARAQQRYTRARQTLETQLLATSAGSAAARTREQLIESIWQLRLLESSATGTLTLVAQPVTPLAPLSPRPTRDAALAGLLALLGSSGAALLTQRHRRRVRGAADLQELRLPVLGELPMPVWPPGHRSAGVGTARRSTKLHSSRVHGAQLHSALGYLRLRLMTLLASSQQSAVVVCGTLGGQDTSGVVAAIAANLGASGLKVLIVDAQSTRPRQRQLWQVHTASWHPLPGAQLNLTSGVATTVSQACSSPEMAQAARVSSQVDVLPSDPPDGETTDPNAVHQASFPALLRQWGSAYDVVLVDAPPMLALPDALAAARGTAGVLLIADVTEARLTELEQALSVAAETGIPVLGCVLTRPGHFTLGVSSRERGNRPSDARDTTHSSQV